MTDLKEQLNQDLKAAMREGDAVRRDAIRALRGAVRNAEIDGGTPLDNAAVLDVLMRQAKQRRDSIEQFQEAGRTDLVEMEQRELDIIEAYLPQQLGDDAIEAEAKAVIAELGVSDMKGMGPVMGRLTQSLKGQADGKRISAIVRQLLSQ